MGWLHTDFSFSLYLLIQLTLPRFAIWVNCQILFFANVPYTVYKCSTWSICREVKVSHFNPKLKINHTFYTSAKKYNLQIKIKSKFRIPWHFNLNSNTICIKFLQNKYLAAKLHSQFESYFSRSSSFCP